MIIVSVSLLSAVTGKTTELARMEISNDGTGSRTKGTYLGSILRGRTKEGLDRRSVTKTATVEDYPRQSLHVWNLVARMLKKTGYS